VRKFALLLLVAATPTMAVAATSNRAIVTHFVDIFYRQKDVKRAFEAYVAPDYVQHNPDIPDGRKAAIEALTPIFSDPAHSFEVKQILVDGDWAAIHLLAKSAPDARGAAVADFYRLKHGRIVEHWDVLQPIPAHAANTHPMF